ncbi:MAG: stalk domain-containing protein [Caldisericia bacterium]|nr:stalk domain-containing protein [Caldisericia bacterium]
MNKKIKLCFILPLLFVLIFSYPLKLSLSAAGSGTCIVDPTQVIQNSTGNTLYFTFTAAEPMESGEISITVPTGFSLPQTTNPAGSGYVTIDSKSSDVYVARLINNMDSSSSWFSSDPDLTISTDSTTKKEGSSLKISVAANANATNERVYYQLLSTENWSPYTAVGFWIRSSTYVPSGALQFAFATSNDLSGATTYSIGSISANTWTYVKIPIVGIANVKTYGFIYNSDYFGTSLGTIWIDDLLISPGNVFISGMDIRVRFLSITTGGWIKIKYENVTAPSTTGAKTFTTKSRVESGQTLTNISVQPTVNVIAPPPATKLVFTSPPPPWSLTAGNWAGPLTVQRQDSSGNPVTSGNLTVNLSTNSPYGKGKFSLTSGGPTVTQVTIPDGSSTVNFYYYDETAGVWTITASATGLTSATQNITVNPSTTTQLVITLPGETFENGKGNTGTPTSQTAGVQFQIRVRYCDAYFNVVPSWNGAITLTFSGPNPAPDGTTPNFHGDNSSPYQPTINFTNGVSGAINVTLYKAETTIIHVTDLTYSGDSSNLIVNGGSLNYFAMQFPVVGTKIAGQSFPLIIGCYDQYQNPTKFSGTVDLSLVDSGGIPISPPPSPLMSPTSVTFNNETSKTVQVTIYKSYDDAYIKAQNHDGTQIGYSSAIDIWHGDLHHFRFSTISPYVEQNVPFSVTIYAEDQWGNLIDNTAGATPYTGTVNLTCSLGIDKITPTTVSFNDATPTDGMVAPSITITYPGTSVTITATDTTLNKTGTSNSFPVFGSIDHYEFDTIGPQVKNLQFSIKVYAKDMVGNTLINNNEWVQLSAEANDGTPITLTVSGGNPIQLVNGVWQGNVAINTPNPQVRIRGQRTGGNPQYGLSNWFSVADNAPTKFIFDTITSPKIAGTPFQITIRAVDYYNSPVINYNGNAILSASTGPGTISPTNITFTNGVWTGNVTLTTPNPSVVITCYDPSTSAMGTSNSFQVTGGVESFKFSTIASPQYKNENIYISIQAIDVNGDIVTGFNGTVNLSSTAGTITPTSVNFVGGMWSGNVKINAEGQNIRIQATYGSKTGFSDPFTILPFSQLIFEPNISSPQYVDVPFSITVKAKTPSGTQATWSGTLSLSCSIGNDKIDKTSLTMTNGIATENIKISQRATGVTLTVQATIYGTTISGTSNTFEVKEGNKLVFISGEQVIPIDTASGDIKVQIQDQDGNPVNATTNVSVNLSSSSTTGRFSSDKNTWSTSNTFTVTIQSGQNQVTFYYKDTTPGVHTLTAKATGLRDGNQTIRVSVDGSGECKISPDSAFVRETNKDFTLTFTSKATMDGGEIQIIVPNAFSQPQKTSPAGEGYISITPGTGVTIGDWTISGYTINIPINVMPKDRTITINYKKVTCPSSTGDYTFDVKTRGPGGTLTPIATMPKVTITLTSVSDVKVSLDPTSASAYSEYTITFKTSTVGQLLSNVDKIYIKFPSGTEVPGVIDAQNILINTVSLNSPPSIDVPKREVTLITPVDIGANSDVTIKFTHKAKIKNPSSTSTNYQVELWTDKDPTHKLSTAYSITSKTSVVNVTVSINPPGANSYGDITVGFKIANALVKDVHTITIIFPSGFDVPPNISPNLITVGGTPLSEAPTIDSGTRTITMITPRDFAKAGTVEIVISKDAKIKNPSKAGKYKLTVYTSQDSNPVDSPLFDILTESQIKDVKCVVSPPTVNKISRWEISFKTGTLGGLGIGGKIWIEFPSGTTIPGTIPSGSVTIDGLTAITQKILSLKIEITTPKEILPNSTVNIVITEDAGIKNPSSPSSTYKIKLSTTAEQTPVESDPFTIYQPPSSSYKIDPANPNGLSGFYITKPVITLSAVSNYDPTPKIYYKWGNEQYKLYTGPLTAPEGINKLYFYAEDKFGNKEDERTIEIKVDTTPPVLSLIEPKEGGFVKIEQVTVVVESKEELLDITLNNNKMVKQTGFRYSITITVKEGENILVIKGRDLAGNTQEITFKIYLDKTPPQVKFTSPTSGQIITTRSIKVTGETEPNSKMKVKVSGVIGTFKEEELISDSKGAFEIEIKNLPPGFIGVTVEVTDQAGNIGKGTLNFIHKQTILLWVGKPEAQIDNEQTYVDPDNKAVTPFILPPGRTMVPLRFISEAFGAKVEWDGTTKTVTITWGSKTIKLTIGVYIAKVDGKDVKLDVAPIIREGRTFVPIRFISEAFGADVKWDATERKITITL